MKLVQKGIVVLMILLIGGFAFAAGQSEAEAEGGDVSGGGMGVLFRRNMHFSSCKRVFSFYCCSLCYS